MSKSLSAIVVSIFMTGFIAGLLAGVGLKTGQDVDPESLYVFVFGTVCNAVPKVSNTSFLLSCDFMVIFLSLMVLIVGIIEIIATAKRIGDWKIGLVIYGIGFIVGVLLVYQ